MMKHTLLLLTLVICGVIAPRFSSAQCPGLTIEATPVCATYVPFCGCKTTHLTVNGTLPPGWTVTNTAFLRNFHYFPIGQTTAPTAVGFSPQEAGGVYPNYELRDMPLDPANTYYIELTFNTGTGTIVCNYIIPIPYDSSPAVPSFVTHAKTVSQLYSGSTFITPDFYTNDPISLDETATTDAFEYILSCTPVNSSGTPVGSTIVNPVIYDPTYDWYIDLRSTFSNLVNPGGLNLYNYYRIDMSATGCGGGPIVESHIIRTVNRVRDIKRSHTIGSDDQENVPIFTIAPNPSQGIFTLNTTAAGMSIVRVCSLSGTEVYSYEGKDLFEHTINLSEIPKGLYIVTLESARMKTSQKISIL